MFSLGILGTNNGEPSDDWLSPSGKNRTSVADFFNSWHVAGGEECKVENSVEAQMRPCERKTNRCSELFKNESSPLSECFSKVHTVFLSFFFSYSFLCPLFVNIQLFCKIPNPEGVRCCTGFFSCGSPQYIKIF